MATFDYVILSSSDGSIIKRFKAIKMSMPEHRTDNIGITAGGGVDKAAGVIMRSFRYVFRIPEDTVEVDMGTLEDLRALFRLNNPSGTPNDVITLTDHYGVTHDCLFNEDITPEPLTTQLEGANAWHYVDVSLLKIPAVGGSGS